MKTKPFALNQESAAEVSQRFYRFGRERVYPSLLERDREGRFDRGIWRELGEQGLFDPTRPLSHQLAAISGLARGSLDIPLTLSAVAHGIVAADLLNEFASEEIKRRFLPDMIAGHTIASVCNSEEKAGTDIRGIQSRLVEDESGICLLELNKRGATNLTQADVIIASVWRCREEEEPSLEVLALDARQGFTQQSHVQNLVGFKTGLTGQIRTTLPLQVTKDGCQVGPDRSGFKILKHCFNVERLFISALLTGVLEGLLEQGIAYVQERESFGKPISEFQYVQEKIIAIYAKKERIASLVDRVTRENPGLHKRDLHRHTQTLALLKMTSCEDALRAANQFYELFGYPAFRLDHLGQKIIRDLMAFKMLGGTKEQQKIILFQELVREFGGGADKDKGKSRKAG